MSNINVKSLLLGIGIGIIITATAGIIYFAGWDPIQELTEQQIIKQAEKYGMVKGSLLQSDSGNAKDSGSIGINESTGIPEAGLSGK